MATEAKQPADTTSLRPTIPPQSEFREARVLVHCPPPVGWIALTADQLHAGRTRATEMFVSSLPLDRDATLGDREDRRPLHTPEGAARVLGVDASWLLRQAREGRVPHVRLGKFVRFDPRAIAEQCGRPAPAAATATPATSVRRTKTGSPGL
jgi:hypothetical protein